MHPAPAPAAVPGAADALAPAATSSRQQQPAPAPAPAAGPGDAGDAAKARLRADIERLERELVDIEHERAVEAARNGDRGVSEQAIQYFIGLLHEYNELKDAGQALFGKLAELEGTLVKQMYERFELELDD